MSVPGASKWHCIEDDEVEGDGLMDLTLVQVQVSTHASSCRFVGQGPC